MKSDTKQPAPMREIGMILESVMEIAVKNGANSISMPDEYVSVAHFLAHPNEYEIPSVPESSAAITDAGKQGRSLGVCMAFPASDTLAFERVTSDEADAVLANANVKMFLNI